MRVLHVIPSVSPRRGGPSVALAGMTRALAELGVECSVVTTNDDGPEVLDVPTRRWVEGGGLRTWFFPRWSPPARALREFAFAPGFPAWLRSRLSEFDLVHVHALFSYLPSRAMSVCRRERRPYVLRPLGLLEPWSLTRSSLRKRAFLAAFDAENIRGAAAVHFTSDRERAVSAYVPAGAGFVAPLGVEIAARPSEDRPAARAGLGIDGEDCMILFLSRWHPKKRIEDLLRALEPLRAERWTLVLAGAGDPEYEARIRAELEKLELDPRRVRLPGFVEGDAKRRLLAAADVFVLPSHSENFGIAVAEAMACRVPVIVSEGVALADIVARRGAGWVVPDAAAGLTQALEAAIRFPQERCARGERAAQAAREHFSWSNTARLVKAQYERIVAEGKR